MDVRSQIRLVSPVAAISCMGLRRLQVVHIDVVDRSSRTESYGPELAQVQAPLNVKNKSVLGKEQEREWQANMRHSGEAPVYVADQEAQ